MVLENKQEPCVASGTSTNFVYRIHGIPINKPSMKINCKVCQRCSSERLIVSISIVILILLRYPFFHFDTLVLISALQMLEVPSQSVVGASPHME